VISQQAKLQQRLGIGTRAFLGLLDQGVGCDVQIVCSDGVVEVLFQVFSDVSSLSIFRGTVCVSSRPVDLFSQAVQGHENWLCSPSSHGEEEQRFIDCAFSVVGERFLMSAETSPSNISFPKDVVAFNVEESSDLRELLFLAKSWRIHVLDALLSRMAKNDAVDSSVQLKTIWDDLSDSLEQNDPETDCVLLVEKVPFRAHRLVLSSQSVRDMMVLFFVCV